MFASDSKLLGKYTERRCLLCQGLVCYSKYPHRCQFPQMIGKSQTSQPLLPTFPTPPTPVSALKSCKLLSLKVITQVTFLRACLLPG